MVETRQSTAVPTSKSLAAIMRLLEEHKDTLKNKFKVREIGVFGSYVADKQQESSDLDIIVDFYEPVGLKYFELKEFLEAVLRLEVDLVVKKGIKPRLKKQVLERVLYL